MPRGHTSNVDNQRILNKFTQKIELYKVFSSDINKDITHPKIQKIGRRLDVSLESFNNLVSKIRNGNGN